MTLRALDYLNAIRYIMKLRDPEGKATIDDIDHLGNRRVRTIDELAADELRKGFLKLRRTVQERMSHPRPAGHDAAHAHQPQDRSRPPSNTSSAAAS